ncbi:hypothetical protein DFJ73DRAFT_797721 [Zopfochytrium polystomum]|nr:hypothetical protein DFJ73DRAFT_797721 [Zopfochytrium polystomum]
MLAAATAAAADDSAPHGPAGYRQRRDGVIYDGDSAAIIDVADSSSSTSSNQRLARRASPPAGWTLLGCYLENMDGPRIMPSTLLISDTVTPQVCADLATIAKNPVFSLEFGSTPECWSNGTFIKSALGPAKTTDLCGTLCQAGSTDLCGGNWYMMVYVQSSLVATSTSRTVATTATSSKPTLLTSASASATTTAGASSPVVSPLDANASSSPIASTTTIALIAVGSACAVLLLIAGSIFLHRSRQEERALRREAAASLYVADPVSSQTQFLPKKFGSNSSTSSGPATPSSLRPNPTVAPSPLLSYSPANSTSFLVGAPPSAVTVSTGGLPLEGGNGFPGYYDETGMYHFYDPVQDQAYQESLRAGSASAAGGRSY